MPENRCVGPTCLYPAAERAARGSVRRIVNLASIAGVVVGLTAISAQAQTLTDALAEAYNTNPQLLAQRALLRSTDEQVPQALSFWRPTGHLHRPSRVCNGVAADSAGPRAQPLPASPDPTTHIITRPDLVQFQAIQPIYRGGRTVAQTRQAINTVEFDAGADPRGRDLGVPGGCDGLSRRSSRPGLGRSRPQQCGGPAQAARSDPGPLPRRRSHPDRCGAGRILARASPGHPGHRSKVR